MTNELEQDVLLQPENVAEGDNITDESAGGGGDVGGKNSDGEEPEEMYIGFGGGDDVDVDQVPAKSKELIELETRAAQLEAQLQALQQQQVKEPDPVAIDPGPMPKIADYNFDDDAHAVAMADWIAKRDAATEQKRAQELSRSEQKRRHDEIGQRYIDGKSKLKVPDFAVAELAVTNKLPVVMQSALLEIADGDPSLVYALGKNAKELDRISELSKSNPVKAIAELGKLQSQITVKPKARRPANPPEKGVQQNSGAVINHARNIEILEKEAFEKLKGDQNKVREYKLKHNIK